MSSVPSKLKKTHAKPPRGRPAATDSLSQPAVADHSALTYLSTFSPRGDLFALLSLAVDKHRLRVYDTVSRQSIAEHVVDTARVTSLCWASLDLSESQQYPSEDPESSQQKKRRRRKRHSQVAADSEGTAPSQVVVLGLSDGTLSLFSITHGRPVRTLSHSSSSSAIVAVAVDESTSHLSPFVWTSGADGFVRLWDASKNVLMSSWASDERIPHTSMAVRPSVVSEEHTDLLVSHHAIRLLSVDSSPSEVQLSEKQKPKELSRFTGHASPIRILRWSGPSCFLSMAEADRFVYVWEVPGTPGDEGKIAASIPLDSDARHLSLSPSSSSFVTVSASGKVSVFPLSSDISTPSPSKAKQKITTLTPKSTISVSTKKGTGTVEVVAAAFIPDEEGRVRVARLVNGVQPAFDVVTYFDDSGDYIENVLISDADAGLATEGEPFIGAPTKRYTESAGLAVRSGVELGQDASMDDLAMRDVDGDLDVDLAELSLGQRLTALNGTNGQAERSSDSSDEEQEPASNDTQPPFSKRRRTVDTIEVVPASSLTRTLIQALHSSDARLLETCLAHSDAALIRNTVRRLTPSLAVPLITACVERLGRGARAANMKGGGGGASSQRGTALISWVKAVLAAHSGHLMTMPDLVARLSGLHATLTTRLTLQDSLLALNGRLDMVISQIELRSSGAPAPLALPKDKRKRPQKHRATRYVEGESENEHEEDNEADIAVEVDSGDEAGSVEDVELGGDEEEEENEDMDGDEEEDEDEDEDDEEEGVPKTNGFIDDEAEEYSEEESEGSE
ncbi:WD40 repeat-like protein [Laetiporus sulphureus 93-53]|uniref:WD40 repeat-like protein n=1 Tax=Laetiporus sulphureus 93-53 TaxID=1314785 RepID=A0A165E4J9_9APHY|nr:WD40 repeat-like protein [Laetiporus sulphureus 93-53]KZT06229.1 WD40 repeat-like protein [Laetiporus sulphureus 93-53]